MALLDTGGIAAVQELFRYAKSEAAIAQRQGESAKQVKDYRAADRHFAYSQAMTKIARRCQAIARERWLK